jgi:hypothetical protein
MTSQQVFALIRLRVRLLGDKEAKKRMQIHHRVRRGFDRHNRRYGFCKHGLAHLVPALEPRP